MWHPFPDGERMDLASWITLRMTRRSGWPGCIFRSHRHCASCHGRAKAARRDHFGGNSYTGTCIGDSVVGARSLGTSSLYKVPRLRTSTRTGSRTFSCWRSPGSRERRWVSSTPILVDPRPVHGDSSRPWAQTTPSATPVDLQVVLEMTNDRKSHAGVPLPAGTARVMVPDARRTPQLVATSPVVDTPEGRGGRCAWERLRT